MQGVLDTIYGVASRTAISLGKKLKLKFDTTDILKVRNQADDAFAKVQAADPTVDDDLVTKRYYTANLPSGGATNGIKTISILVGTDATTSATEQLPANAIVHQVDVDVTTPYSTGATLDIGKTGGASALVANAVIDEEAQDFLSIPMLKAVGGSAYAPLATVGGSPSAGGALVVIHYSTPLT